VAAVVEVVRRKAVVAVVTTVLVVVVEVVVVLDSTVGSLVAVGTSHGQENQHGEGRDALQTFSPLPARLHGPRAIPPAERLSVEGSLGMESATTVRSQRDRD